MPDREDQVTTERRLGGLYHSLGLRLFLWLFGIMIVVFAGYAYVTLRGTSQHWREMLYQGASRSSELIELGRGGGSSRMARSASCGTADETLCGRRPVSSS